MIAGAVDVLRATAKVGATAKIGRPITLRPGFRPARGLPVCTQTLDLSLMGSVDAQHQQKRPHDHRHTRSRYQDDLHGMPLTCPYRKRGYADRDDTQEQPVNAATSTTPRPTC